MNRKVAGAVLLGLVVIVIVMVTLITSGGGIHPGAEAENPSGQENLSTQECTSWGTERIPPSPSRTACPVDVECVLGARPGKKHSSLLLRIVEMGVEGEDLYLNVLAINNRLQPFDLHREGCAHPLLRDQEGREYPLQSISPADRLRVDASTTFAVHWVFGPLPKDVRSLQLGINTKGEGARQGEGPYWTEPFGDKCLARLRTK